MENVAAAMTNVRMLVRYFIFGHFFFDKDVKVQRFQ